MRSVLALTVAAALGAQVAVASNHEMEELRIVGTRDDAGQLPGSAAVIDAEQIRNEVATDINKLLETVPGVYIQEEDGYGLRPNIGIRGATSERASKITLMEDGVLIAPAPYSNPAAYYFPTAMRMQTVEILKGAPLLRYGPQTTGGVVNMVSTPIPDELGGSLRMALGEDWQADMLASVGGRSGGFGFLLETVQRQSDGFKDIDRSEQNSGYRIQDYLLKMGWEDDRQSILFKAQYSEETSDETYLGLTDRDFNTDPNRRYGLSELDRMENDHRGFSLTYRLALTDQLGFTAIAYHNEFNRDWFKLGGGGSYVSAANGGDSFAQGVLDGTQDVTGLGYKHNNRSYESQGIDINFDWQLGDHAIAFGGRAHKDEMDRYQPTEFYDQINGELVFDSIGEATGSDNRLEEADANAFWLLDSWQLSDRLNLSLALRYEEVESQRKQYAEADRSDDPAVRGNDSDEWLPGASFTYDVSEHWQVLAGVHRGFSPLGGGAVETEEAETSTNWEAGVRYRGDWRVEAIGFYSDFENKTENCSNANPCSNGATSGSFNTGEAVIAGLEFSAGTVLAAGDADMPLQIMYTYTDAQVSADNSAAGFSDGDDLAAVPEHTFSLRIGIESDMGWDNYAVARYMDEMCMSVGCNRSDSRYDRSESLFVLDYISRYAMNDNTLLFFKLENLMDEQEIVSRLPDGARPNKPRTASIGVEYSF